MLGLIQLVILSNISALMVTLLSSPLSAVIVTHNVGLCNGNGSDSIMTKIALATRVCKCSCLFVADESEARQKRHTVCFVYVC